MITDKCITYAYPRISSSFAMQSHSKACSLLCLVETPPSTTIPPSEQPPSTNNHTSPPITVSTMGPTPPPTAGVTLPKTTLPDGVIAEGGGGSELTVFIKLIG